MGLVESQEAGGIDPLNTPQLRLDVIVFGWEIWSARHRRLDAVKEYQKRRRKTGARFYTRHLAYKWRPGCVVQVPCVIQHAKTGHVLTWYLDLHLPEHQQAFPMAMAGDGVGTSLCRHRPRGSRPRWQLTPLPRHRACRHWWHF